MSGWQQHSRTTKGSSHHPGAVASSPPNSSATPSSWSAPPAGPIAQAAKELGIYDSTLGNWVRQAQIDDGQRAGLTSDERARLGELERENARLRMERDLLKRTVAFWVKEPSTP